MVLDGNPTRTESRGLRTESDHEGSGSGLSPRPSVLSPRLLAALLLLGHSLLHVTYTIDDAAISYVYARNLALGQGWVFQPGGETVEGVTNLLWVLLVAGGIRIGLDPLLVSKVLGILAALGILWLAATFPWSGRSRGGFGFVGGGSRRPGADRRSGPDPSYPVILRIFPAILVAVAAPVAIWSVAGLETTLFGFLLLAGCAALVRGATSGRERRGATTIGAYGLLLAAALTRPEGALYLLVAGLLSAVWWLRDRASLGLAWLIGCLLGVAGLAGLTLWRMATFTYPLPNTFYAKAGERSLTGLWTISAT